MDEADASATPGRADDGVAAVLYGMFASFTEALDGFDRRLAAIEAALRAGPGETAERLRSIESALAALPRPSAEAGGGTEAAVASLREMVEARTAALHEAVAELHRLLQAHAEEASNSLGRRAGEASRRLVNDLAQRARARPGGPPEAR